MGWSDFTHAPRAADHGVQIYRDLEELVGAVVPYLIAGFERGEPGVVIATPDRWAAMVDALTAAGWPEERTAPLLTVADAEATLALFMDDDEPDPGRFEAVVGGLVDRIAAAHPGKRVRAFGEMVDVLWAQRNPEAALALERLWDELATGRNFSLLCGYRFDVFDVGAQTRALPRVCRSHTHVRATADPVRLARAVDEALHEILGASATAAVYRGVAGETRDKRIPVAQLLLMWVSENLPALAGRVLAAARARYDTPQPVSS